MTKDSDYSDHLFVLLHGLWGNKGHMASMKKQIKRKLPKVHVFVPSSFSGNLTYDGVAVCGDRVLADIDKISKKHEYKKFSIVGYSLGGLIARYVVGKLLEKGFFDLIEPYNFTTFASPHLGVFIDEKSAYRYVFNTYGRNYLSQSGRDLFVTKDSILPTMAEEDSIYMEALRRFRKLILYSNIVNDRSVPFFTSFIDYRDPFRDLTHVCPQYISEYEPNILDLSKPMVVRNKPYKRSWSTRDYIFISTLATVGPVMIVIALSTIAVCAQFSEKRVISFKKSRLIKPSSASESIAESTDSTTSDDFSDLGVEEESSNTDGKYEEDHHDDEAEMMQIVVEDMLDASASGISDEDGDLNLYSDSTTGNTTPESHGSVLSTSFSLDAICNDTIHDTFEVADIQLNDIQQKMSESLNKLAWKKFAVHIHGTLHSHAIIVDRRGGDPEGLRIISHYLNTLEL
ncbi:putative serine esterase-domain-containing protein [Dipodascopsis uninucleata]